MAQGFYYIKYVQHLPFPIKNYWNVLIKQKKTFGRKRFLAQRLEEFEKPSNIKKIIKVLERFKNISIYFSAKAF